MTEDHPETIEPEVVDGEPSSPSTEELLARLQDAERERDEVLDNLRRVAADFDNYRKRVATQSANDVQTATGKMAEALLPVLDASEAAFLQHPAEIEPLFNLLLGELKKLGLESIDDTIMGFSFSPSTSLSAPPDIRVSVTSTDGTYCTEIPSDGARIEVLFAQLQQKDQSLGTCTGAPFTGNSSTITSIDFVGLNTSLTTGPYNFCLYELNGLYPPAP